VAAEELGFDHLYDCTAGKVDWLAAGQPTEGTGSTSARVISTLDATVPTCGLDADTGEAVERAKAAGWPICVVVNDVEVVAGRLRVDSIAGGDHHRAEEAMEPGPVTVRANDELAPTLARMAERHVAVLLVTTPEGILLGAVRAQR
jgi:CBS domain-containing protein